MLWFKESINAAISTAQQNNSIFLVYIRGSDDDGNTKTMDETWEDGEVGRICKEGGVVAIRLDASSLECAQFSEHYPVVCIPSVSFIDGGNGAYLEAIAGAVTSQELVEKIKNMIAKKSGTNSNQQTLTDANTQASSPDVAPQAAASEASQATASATPQAAASATPEATTPKQTDNAKLSAAPAAKQNESIEQRAARLRQKMSALQEKKEKKKKEVERQKEIERRETGKSVQEQKRKNQEAETLRAAQERKKEKQEDEKHRKLVREQLEKDKLEKKTRFEAEKRERDVKRERMSVQNQEKINEEEIERKRRRMESSRIQFRLPDGSTFTNRFQATATFSEVYELIKQKITSEDLRSSFMMSTMYPRRHYDSNDMGRTLSELNLVPDASIIVLPDNTVQESNSLVMTLLWPFLALWNFIVVLLFGRSSSTPPSNPNAGDPQSSRQAGASDPSSGEPGPSTGARPKSSYGRRPASRSSGMRQEGNIHRFATSQDDDDENNTWNGNSTQQM